MIIRASKHDTGLSHSYLLETHSIPHFTGEAWTKVLVKDLNGKLLGSWVNPRQDVGDNRPFVSVWIQDVDAMAEVLPYFSEPKGSP